MNITKRQSTSKDVAKLAGVSRTTVSLVLNSVENAQISAETRQRVFLAAEALEYVPNATAQALVSRRTQVIGLLLTRQPHQLEADGFVLQALEGMLEVVRAHRLRLLIDVVEPEHQERAYLDLVRAKRIDGIVFSGPRSDDAALQNLEREGFPTILMGHLPNSPFCSVDVDNVLAARQATEYLLSLGHRRIACITNAPLSYSAAAERLLGYQQALQAAGIIPNPALLRQGGFDPQSGYEAMVSLLQGAEPFSAAFVASDTVLMGAKRAIRERGLQIPQDMSLLGFDDIPWAQYADPPMTTVHLPARDLGKQACQMLLQVLNAEKPPNRNLILPAPLVIRQSCQPV